MARDQIIPRLHAMHIRANINEEGNRSGAGETGLANPAVDRCGTLLGELLGPAADVAVARWGRRLQVEDQSTSLRLLTDAARLLGRQWVEDERSFADVTVAVLRLEALLRGLSHRPSPSSQVHAGASVPRRCLLLAVPGEQHGFGVRMLAHVFRGRAWQVELATIADATELDRLICRVDPDLVGFSLSAEMHLSRLARCISAVRRTSPDLSVMVGGPVFVARPELAARLGADATAPDAESAVTCAEALPGRRRTRASGPRRAAGASPGSPAPSTPDPAVPQSTQAQRQCHSGPHECA